MLDHNKLVAVEKTLSKLLLKPVVGSTLYSQDGIPELLTPSYVSTS
jgi:hypothetical protein